MVFLWMAIAIVCLECGTFNPIDAKTECATCLCGARGCKARHVFERDVAHELGIAASTLSQWKKKTDAFAAECDMGRAHCKLVYAESNKARYPDQENCLYRKFIKRRKCMGLPADAYWLRWQFAQILKRDFGTVPTDFKFSNGWLHGFCVRYNITSQCKTDKKSKPIEERLPEVREFHAFMKFLQNSNDSSPQFEPQWGAYPPRFIWNCWSPA